MLDTLTKPNKRKQIAMSSNNGICLSQSKDVQTDGACFFQPEDLQILNMFQRFVNPNYCRPLGSFNLQNFRSVLETRKLQKS